MAISRELQALLEKIKRAAGLTEAELSELRKALTEASTASAGYTASASGLSAEDAKRAKEEIRSKHRGNQGAAKTKKTRKT